MVTVPKRLMKKGALVGLLLGAVLALLIAACGEDEATSAPTAAAT